MLQYEKTGLGYRVLSSLIAELTVSTLIKLNWQNLTFRIPNGRHSIQVINDIKTEFTTNARVSTCSMHRHAFRKYSNCSLQPTTLS